MTQKSTQLNTTQ